MRVLRLALAVGVTCLICSAVAFAAPLDDVQRVSDINPGPGSGSPYDFTQLGGYVYFGANNGTSGTELWRTDGTAAGTSLVANIDPSGSSFPQDFVELNGFLYFQAYDPSGGFELWRTDGTASGTTRVADINPGSADSNPSELTRMGSYIYFSADDGTTGTELWRTDGTGGGTTPVADINSSGSSSPSGFTVLGGRLYFAATNTAAGRELWRTDGTTTGRVTDINSGTANSSPVELTVLGANVYFAATDGTGSELWRSDGTTTVRVADVNPSGSSQLSGLSAANGYVYFSAFDGTGSFKVFRANSSGASQVSTVNPGFFDVDFVPLGDQVYFGGDGGSGTELWRTDGTTTTQVADLVPGSGSSNPKKFVVLDGNLYFQAGGTDRELWRSGGTAETTARIKDIVPGATGSDPDQLTPFGNSLLFSAESPGEGRELFRAIVTPPPAPAPGPGAADTGVTGVRVFAKKKQKQNGNKVVVKLRGGAAEAVTGVASGSIRVNGVGSVYKLKKVKHSSAAGELATYRLTLKKQAQNSAVLALLNDGRGLKAKMTLRLTDQVGNSAARRLSVR